MEMRRGKPSMTEYDGGATPSKRYPTTETIEDFDPIEREAYEWVERFMSGDMTSADVEAMKAWYGRSPAHAAAYADVRRLWRALGPAASAVMRRSGEVGREGGRCRPSPPSLGRRAFLGGTLAASAAAAAYMVIRPPLALWPSYAEWEGDYRTGVGEQRRVTLAGAVSLDLNTRTSVAIRSQTADATRIELISGEMAITTDAASPPLTVVAKTGRIVAAKADFNLRCDGDEVRVSCLAGDLKVERAGAAIQLVAGQQVVYGGRGMGVTTTADADGVTAWRRGMLIFEATPVARVIEEVNRYRPGRVILMNPEIGRRLLNARLQIAEADKIVVQIVHIFGAKATTLPGGVVVLT